MWCLCMYVYVHGEYFIKFKFMIKLNDLLGNFMVYLERCDLHCIKVCFCYLNERSLVSVKKLKI